MEKKETAVQFVKFALVGVLNTLIDFLVYTLLVLIFGVKKDSVFLIGLFTFIGYACGVLNSYIFNSKWTFKKEHEKSVAEVVKFIVVNLVAWGVSFALVWAFSNFVFAEWSLTKSICELIGFTTPEKTEKIVSILSKLLATPIVIMINFVGNKLFVFVNKKQTGNGQEANQTEKVD